MDVKKSKNKIGNKGTRVFLVAAGIICTILAVIGIFLPLLPTVPLLLLASACFARSSERFLAWLHNNPYLGPIIHEYQGGKGIPLRAKIIAIVLIWISIPFSAFFFTRFLWLRVLLLTIGICVTVYLLRLPVREAEDEKMK